MLALAPLVVMLGLLSPQASLPATVGKVSFPISCKPAAQSAFTRGVSAMHSFWYGEALAQFGAAEKSDPACAMAYWGEALAHLELLWLRDDVPAARAALAKMPAEPPTAREQAWLAALRPLLGDDDLWPRRAAFRQAMERLHQQFPDDDEGKAFLALALLTASPDDSLSLRARAAALAFEVLAHNPEHPGALHYAIHALDTPELAPLGLPAARRYAATAPEAFHARHMPAHIFGRLGMWKEALASCESAWEVSQAWVERARLSPDKRDYHSLQWIIAIDVELGRLGAAEAALQRFLDGARRGGPAIRGWYASLLAEHLRAVDGWARLDALVLPPTTTTTTGEQAATPGPACHGPAQRDVDLAQLSTVNARRWAAAARRDAGETARLTATLVELRARRAGELEKRLGKAGYARYAEAQSLADAARLATAKGDAAAAAGRWQRAAALEDRDPPSEGADDLGGAHWLAGESFLRAGRAADARRELEMSLVRYPAHTATFLLLGRACDKLGDAAAARASFARAAELWREADEGFAPAVEARAWLASHPATAAR